MQDQNAESIKSLEGYRLGRGGLKPYRLGHWRSCDRRLERTGPSCGSLGTHAASPMPWMFLRQASLQNAIVVKANFPENPFFPAALEEEMQLDRERYPDRFEHIWLGDYAKAFEGAYYAGVLTDARRAIDPILFPTQRKLPKRAPADASALIINPR